MQKQYKSSDISRFFNVTIATVGNWIKDGKLPAYETIGGHYRFEAADIIAFIKKNKMNMPDELKGLPTAKATKYKVLIVDDNTALVKTLQEIIETLADDIGESIGVDTAKNGFDAGVKVVELMPDLIVLDGRMPGREGADVCRDIRNNVKFSEIKILGYTGYEEEAKKLSKSGADVVLVKGTREGDLESLRREISRLIGIKILKVKV